MEVANDAHLSISSDVRLQRWQISSFPDLAILRSDSARHLVEYKNLIKCAKEINCRNYVGESADETRGVATATRGQHLFIAYRNFFTRSNSNALEVRRHPHYALIEKICLSVMATRPRNSPGLDNVSQEVLKANWATISHHLIVLDEWKVGNVMVLLRAHYKVRSNARSYKSRSLLLVPERTAVNSEIRVRCYRVIQTLYINVSEPPIERIIHGTTARSLYGMC